MLARYATMGCDTGERRTGVGGARGLTTVRRRPEGRPRGSLAQEAREDRRQTESPAQRGLATGLDVTASRVMPTDEHAVNQNGDAATGIKGLIMEMQGVV